MKKAREEAAEEAAEAGRKKKPRCTAAAEAGAADSPPAGGVGGEVDTRAKCLLLLGEALRDPTPLFDTATAVEVRKDFLSPPRSYDKRGALCGPPHRRSRVVQCLTDA